jgi:ADP-ribosylglycohydrolase
MIVGHAIGDALGVPVEFMSREEIAHDPVAEMRGYGTHHQPPGTWSDDTSMTLCLLESIVRLGRIDYKDIMDNFVSWLRRAEFTATGTTFDVGIAIAVDDASTVCLIFHSFQTAYNATDIVSTRHAAT